MTSQEAPKQGLQFDQAEPATTVSAGTACAACGTALADTYHTINDQVLCDACRRRIEAEWTGGSGSSRAGKAFLLGLAGAAVGAGIYYGVLALTGYEIGLIAIVVGYLAGRGVRMGSGGRGGPGYQAMAMLLTYVAIVSTYVPLILGTVEGDALSLVAVFIAAFAMPFLMGTENLIGLLIIGIAVFQAWAMNKRASLVFAGPFRVKAPAA
jgi:hypothetical protein